jgi:hypothetical protein
MAKLTKTQLDNLNRIWTTKVAYGAKDGAGLTGPISASLAATVGYGWISYLTSGALVRKGLARKLVTKDEVLGHRVVVLVLTDAGRAAIGA